MARGRSGGSHGGRPGGADAPGEVRLRRLERVALQRASEVVAHELSDPRLTMVTLTRIKLAADLSAATLFWSVLGGQADRNKVQRALTDSASVVQSEIAHVFHTRRSPRIRFEFDPSIEGAIRMSSILGGLAADRPADGEAPASEDATPKSEEE